MNQPITRGLSAPLRALPDMPARWQNLDTDFDTAAQILVSAHQRDGAADDRPVMDLRTWAIHGQQGVFSLTPLGGQAPPRPLRRTALSNLTSRIGAPADFIKKLPAELQLANLNYLLASHPRPLSSQLRLRGDDVTAVVSERYTPLDAEQFVESLRGSLAAQGVLQEVTVKAVATGTTDAIRLVLPGESRELKLGDVSSVGLDVSTSSFGKSAIHVKGMVWRLVCENGLRAPEQMGSISFRHVGDTQRLRDGLSDAVPTALTHARGLMGAWQQAITSYVDHVGRVIERMRELTQTERDGVESELMKSLVVSEVPERTSVFEVINAITRTAHNVEPARRLELETLGGRFLLKGVS